MVQARDGFLVLKKGASSVVIPEEFYSVFLTGDDALGAPVRVRFGSSRRLVGLTLDPGPGAAYYLHTYWQGDPAAGDDLHVCLALVDRSVTPNQVVAVQELAASAFVPAWLWGSGRRIRDTVFVFFPPDPESYALGLLVGTEQAREDIVERCSISVEVGTDMIQVEDDTGVLFLSPGGWE